MADRLKSAFARWVQRRRDCEDFHQQCADEKWALEMRQMDREDAMKRKWRGR